MSDLRPINLSEQVRKRLANPEFAREYIGLIVTDLRDRADRERRMHARGDNALVMEQAAEVLEFALSGALSPQASPDQKPAQGEQT